MMLVMCGLMWLMPKIQPEMDDEDKKKMMSDLQNDDSMSANIIKKLYGGGE